MWSLQSTTAAYNDLLGGVEETVAKISEIAAAGSEEMASSSEELGAQATALRDLVSRFKTDTSTVTV